MSIIFHTQPIKSPLKIPTQPPQKKPQISVRHVVTSGEDSN